MDNNTQNGADLLNALILRAEEGKHSDFEYIRSLSEYWVVIKMQRALQKVKTSFKDAYNKAINLYSQQVKETKTDMNLLLSIVKFEFVYNFYAEEYNILEDMKDEYRSFLSDSNWLKSILGHYREDFECWDYRKRIK